MDPYQSAIIKHIKEFTSRMDDYYVDTVYFGGGTPSYYGFRRVDEIFETIKKNYKVMRDAEITIEANPESVTKDDFIKLKRSGFTRVSLGVQSLDNKMLKRIGRIHTVEQTYNAIDAIRAAGFDNLSLDLIYGLPSQTREEWAETLTEAMRTGPEHISAYGLTIGQNSKLWNLRNSPGIPDDDAQADMYLYAVDSLNNSGFHQYEISNYSKPGKESIHNLKYWTLKEYCGFGASASSMIGGTRFTYLKDVENYINAVESGGALLVTDETETLNPYETAAEYIMVGMRTTNGVSRNEYESIYRGGFLPLEQILDSYIRLGFAVKRGNRYSFTPKGFLLSNRLIGELLDAQAERKFQIGTPWRENDYFNTLI
jgi:oxygen-independent coproporphyrinogen-3 oxidase